MGPITADRFGGNFLPTSDLKIVREHSKLSDVPSLNLFHKRKVSRTRRESMIHVLRNDLESLESLPAVQKYRRASSLDLSNLSEEDRRQSVKYDDVFSSRSTSRIRNRRASIGFERRRSRHASSALSGSDSPGDLIINITDAELKKIRMLESLSNMGLPKPHRRVRKTSGTELKLYENLRLQKKQSLTSRMLISTKSRKYMGKFDPIERKKQLLSPMKTPSPTPDQREKMKKVVDMMSVSKTKSDDGPNPFTIRKGSLAGSDNSGELINSFRKRFRRKKVREKII